jgi:hypothetical protein
MSIFTEAEPFGPEQVADPAAGPAAGPRPVPPLPRPDWRDSIALAADLALLGIVVAIACLPVVTAGGALVAASVGVDRAGTDRSFPAARELLAVLRRNLLRGFAAVLLAMAAAGAVAVDLLAVAGGRVPGGPVLAGLTAVLAAAGLAVAGTALVRLGQTGGEGYRAALRYALALLGRRPLAGLGIVIAVALPVLLAGIIPATAIMLPGFVLFGLHAVVRKAMR